MDLLKRTQEIRKSWPASLYPWLPENMVRVIGPVVLLALRNFEAELRSGAAITIDERVRCRAADQSE